MVYTKLFLSESRQKLVYISRSLKRRSLSSPTKDEVSNEVSSSARDISVLFDVEKSKGIEISKLLSPSARKELSQINKSMRQKSSPSVVEPSRYDLKIHALTCGIPFIGFGIMDNAILIWAGDKIDTHLGVLFGISTLCAAAIGNIVSDIAGVGLGAYIEDFCATKLRLPKVNLSNAQRNLRSVRIAGQLGNMIGLTIGCVIGMFPLLFIDTEEVQHKKKDAHMDAIFKDVVTETKGLIGAESTCLYLMVDDKTTARPTPFSPGRDDKDGKFLYAKYATEDIDSIERSIMKKPIGQGIVGRAASSGEVTLVSDVNSDPDHDPTITSIHKIEDGNIRNMLCVPVFDVNGSVIAVIQAVNKVEEGAAKANKSLRRTTISKGFTRHDAKVLTALASHISVTLQNMHMEEDASLKEIIKILKEHGT